MIINPYNKSITKVEGTFCGRPISLEVNKLAFQATAAVTVTYGDCVILGIAQVGKPVPGLDYFPLSIDYEEKMYAAGKISGSRFLKREGRPTDDAILAGRIIDRPIRPLFPKDYKNEVQGIATVLSVDPELRSDCVAMIAVSAALMLSGTPFEGPVAGVHVGLINNELVAFPTNSQMSESQMDLCVAGTKEAIMMVECGSNEVSEEKVAEALQYGHSVLADAVEIQNKLIEACGGRKIEEYEPAGHHEHVTDTIYEFVKDKLGENVRGINNKVREEKTDALWHQLRENFKDHEGFEEHYGIWRESFENILKKEVRRAILEEGIRPDGRGTEEIRTISCETGLLPRTHGSAIFTRGTTQALNVVTLASLKYAQTVETMEEDTEKTYIHHYNMPGYSTGECRRLGNPGRREIGHGALAERALIAVLPSTAQFPYTIRTVSEIMSSNGSTSMASVCSSCLALMDAGVPIKAPVSGIAMGLIGDGNGKFVILSDIQGVEDFAGDMDFKVAGTKNGITALQMDIKIHGISPKLMAEALSQAKRGRDHILDEMLKVLPEPKKEMSPYAPRVESLQINPELIGKVIGKGGETIQDITADSGAEIDINDDGIVMISSPNAESIQKAKEMILALTAVPEVGKIYSGKVVKIMDFGAFVNIMPGIDGMVHISALKNERVEKVTDVLKEGDVVNVKLVAIDDRGKLSLSMKDAI